VKPRLLFRQGAAVADWHLNCFGDGTKPLQRGLHRMAGENFEPIRLNAKAPGGERVLGSFDDIGAFILVRVEISLRRLPRWQAVRKDLAQARFGARQKEGLHCRKRDGWPSDAAEKQSLFRGRAKTSGLTVGMVGPSTRLKRQRPLPHNDHQPIRGRSATVRDGLTIGRPHS
jgi:hypothetical protein